jgi:hypothetical protein
LHARQFLEENARELAGETNATSAEVKREERELKGESEATLDFEGIAVKAKFAKLS